MAKAPETVGASDVEKTVEVRLLRNYVPAIPDRVEGTPDNEPVFVKIPAGTVISLPRSEARDVIAKGIAAVTADLI
jgi:hypothetical protein